jgi:hypothetical protein
MSDPSGETWPMKEELAIACILHVAQQEQLTPENVLWALVPMANRHIVSDTSQYEKATETARQSSQPDTEDHPVSRCAG